MYCDIRVGENFSFASPIYLRVPDDKIRPLAQKNGLFNEKIPPTSIWVILAKIGYFRLNLGVLGHFLALFGHYFVFLAIYGQNNGK